MWSLNSHLLPLANEIVHFYNTACIQTINEQLSQLYLAQHTHPELSGSKTVSNEVVSEERRIYNNIIGL